MQNKLTEAMATSATGYAAVIDGVLDIRTTSDNLKGATIYALRGLGYVILVGCPDPECDCILRNLPPELKDRIEIVAVSVTRT